MPAAIHEINSIGPNFIDLIVYDFDGVMTNNKVILHQDGTEAVVVNRSDGLGVDMLRKQGIPQIILSTEKNPVVKKRGKKLKLDVIQNCSNKKETLVEYCETHGYRLQRVAYIGNDLNDLEAMRIVGFPVAPADAHPEIKSLSKFVTLAAGGEGVVKEFAEFLLKQSPALFKIR